MEEDEVERGRVDDVVASVHAVALVVPSVADTVSDLVDDKVETAAESSEGEPSSICADDEEEEEKGKEVADEEEEDNKAEDEEEEEEEEDKPSVADAGATKSNSDSDTRIGIQTKMSVRFRILNWLRRILDLLDC